MTKETDVAENKAEEYIASEMVNCIRNQIPYFDFAKQCFVAGHKTCEADNKDKLAQAIEIIKDLLPLTTIFVFNTRPKLKEEVRRYRNAEQFLKEVSNDR